MAVGQALSLPMFVGAVGVIAWKVRLRRDP
jgi:hypothetical protein